jgi:hypothetical protein
MSSFPKLTEQVGEGNSWSPEDLGLVSHLIIRGRHSTALIRHSPEVNRFCTSMEVQQSPQIPQHIHQRLLRIRSLIVAGPVQEHLLVGLCCHQHLQQELHLPSHTLLKMLIIKRRRLHRLQKSQNPTNRGYLIYFYF